MKPKAKRLLSIFLALALVMGIAPVVSQTAQAAENTGGKTIQLGTGGIVGPEEKTTYEGTTYEGKYYTPNSYVYFGVNGDGEDKSPIQWRVLDAEKANDGKTAGAFLLSEYLLASGVQFEAAWDYDDDDGQTKPNDWRNSDAQAWCSTFASNKSNFTPTEQAAMLGVDKTDSAEGSLYDIWWGESGLTTADKVFFLSVRELANYVGNYNYAPGLTASFDDGVSAGAWRLRSPYANIIHVTGVVTTQGYVNSIHYVYRYYAARPAFNLNLDSVLFTSAAAGGGNGGEAAGAIFEIQPYTGNEWKLTLKDTGRQFEVTDKSPISGKPGETLTFAYTDATVKTDEAPNDWISAILADEDGNALYYGRLTQPTSADGDVTITLPDGLTVGDYTIKLFSEQYNGDYMTDYASEFQDAKLTVVNTYSITYNNVNGATNSNPATYTIADTPLALAPLTGGPTGYTFDGWYDNAEFRGSVVTEIPQDSTGDITLYAKWKKTGSGGDIVMQYTLTYETNGGSAIASTKHNSGTTVNLTVTPTRAGYTFDGWYSDAALTDKITSVKMDGDKTVYAGWEENDLRPTPSPYLNYANHIAFIAGYPDGTFGPNRNITRAESATMIYRLLTDARKREINATANSFSDVDSGKWYNTYVSSMAKGGYVAGYPDGTFGGEKSITRAEFVTILVRFFDPAPISNSFTDVSSSHWAYESIMTASAYGWINGYEDGTFRPDRLIIRAEAVAIINRILNRGIDANSTLGSFKNFTDNTDANAWYYYEIIEAANSHEYTGERPSEDWTKITN
ncbi:MAG: S-layer homology domain-containing protein [Clostridia bacterium]|nr:S-layer homology domain-containing protein [Clostridia bacterium]